MCISNYIKSSNKKVSLDSKVALKLAKIIPIPHNLLNKSQNEITSKEHY